MPERYDAILTNGEWIDALHELSLCCADSTPAEARDRLREMATLMVMAPDTALLRGVRPIGPERLHALLEADALETAVLAMLDDGSGFLLSRSGCGQSLATIALSGQLREKSASGTSPALALIGALAVALCSASTRKTDGTWLAPPEASAAVH